MKRMQAWVVGAALAGLPAAAVLFSGSEVAAQASQGQVWIQIEAKNSRARIEERLRHWAESLPNVNGFVMASGWYAAALGPYDRDEAAALLNELRLLRAIPSDSFIADGRIYRGQLDPVAAAPLAPAMPGVPGDAGQAPISGAEGAPTSAIEVAPLGASGAAPMDAAPTETAPAVAEPAVAEPVARLPAETLAEARRAEAALSREERMDIQRALIWAGALSGGVDGAFGPGTRGAIAAWQTQAGGEPTGVLTSVQRRSLVEGWRAEIAALGLETLRDEEAGIEVALPLKLVGFDAYAPPFARYAPKDGSGMEIRLISQPGDAQALSDLYDRLEAASDLPPGGSGTLRARGFELSGTGAETEVHASAELSQGVIKGFVLTARREDAARTARVLQALEKSFRSLEGQVLDPGLVPLDEGAKAAMLTGVERESPRQAGSGFFATAQGHVVTAAALVESCGRITLDGGVAARRIASDPAAGVALLQPEAAMSPKGIARFSAVLPRSGSEVAVAGYSFGIDLPLPSMTFGRFEAPTALDGAPERARLQLPALSGDVGGAVLGEDGQVLGVLQPGPQDAARALPAGVAYVAPAALVVAALAAAAPGMAQAAPAAPALPPEDLSRIGNEMAVQVLCWD